MKLTTDILRQTSGIGLDFVGRYILLLAAAGTGVALMAACTAAAIFGAPFWNVFSLIALAVAIVILAFVLTSSREISRWLAGMIAEAIEWSRAEREARFRPAESALPAVPALPEPPPADPAIPTSGAGPQQLRDAQGDLIGVEDLEWLCEYIAAKRSWTERTLENLYLPYSKQKITTGETGTYARILALFVDKGIVGADRGPRKTGTLLVKDPVEMLKLLRNQKAR